MTKLTSMLAAGSLCLALASCTIEVQEEKPNNKPNTTVAPAPKPMSDNETFLGSIYREYPQLEYRFGDAWLIELGVLICASIDEGMTLEGLALIVTQTGSDPGQIGWIAGAAIAVFCPRHQWFIDSAGI